MINYAFNGFVEEGDRLSVSDRADEVPGRFLSYVLFLHAALNRDKIRLGTPETFLASGEKFFYVQEFTGEFPKLIASYNGRLSVISETMPPAILDAVRRGQATLLFSLAQEGYLLRIQTPGVEYFSFFDLIQNFATLNELPPKQVWFIHGNLASHLEFTAWLRGREIAPVNAFRFFQVCAMITALPRLYELHRAGRDLTFRIAGDVWSAPTTTTIEFKPLEGPPFEQRYMSPSEVSREVSEGTLRSHKFICLNNSRRAHRRTVVALLHAFDMLPSGLVSMTAGWGRSEMDSVEHPDIVPALFAAWAEIEPRLPLTVDVAGGDHLSAAFAFWVVNSDPYRRSYINFITETLFRGGDTVFITEKVVKPMLFLQPFVVFGSPHTLRYLRGLGFQTFSRVIDERYDEEPDRFKRMLMLTQIVERVAAMSPADVREMFVLVLPEIVHNFEHLFRVRDPLLDILSSDPDALG